MSVGTLLSNETVERITKTIITIANGSPKIYVSEDIRYCADIVNKLSPSTPTTHKLATGKISSKLNRSNIKHTEADLDNIAKHITNSQLTS